MSSQFRTPSGQTGPDAYLYEATQIMNALRDLDARAARLAAVMVAELPANARVRVSIATDRFPDAFMNADRESLSHMLPMMGSACDARRLADFARALADPGHIVGCYAGDES